MRLNTLQRAPGARSARKRVGRGIGSGTGKTAGRGSKGQRSRAGGNIKAGFEGGQMPLQRRLPKRGFKSMTAKDCDEIRLHELAKVGSDTIDLEALKQAGLVKGIVNRVKVIASGTLDKAVHLQGIAVTRGARVAIEQAGGTVEV